MPITDAPRSAAAPGSQATSAQVARHATQISADARRDGPSDSRSVRAAFIAPIGRARQPSVNQTDGRCGWCGGPRSGAIVLCQREPGIDNRVRVERNALDVLLDQPLRKLGIIRRNLAPDAGIL